MSRARCIRYPEHLPSEDNAGGAGECAKADFSPYPACTLSKACAIMIVVPL
jgi:hypothetical protein